VVVGCGDSGPPKTVIKGVLSDGGKVIPVKVTESKSGQWLRLWLRDASGKGDVYDANIKFDDGTFVIAGGDGRGVPAGKYKVFVQWNEKYPMGKDLLNDKFSETNSKIIRDLPGDGVLNIDVSKPEG
jgi:hypothetical protein